MDERLLFQLLGPVRAWRGEAEIDLGTPQQRAILGLLLLRADAMVTFDRLISAVWGENPPLTAAGMVRTYVSRLRRALRESLAPSLIRSVTGGYVLSIGSASVDVADFDSGLDSARRARHVGDLEKEATHLRAALGLWRGAPLGGVRGEYADHERSRLINLQLGAIEDLAAADLELGNHAEAGIALVPVLTQQPLRERPRELMMLALYRAGRKAEALALYQDTQQLLATELGLDPGPDLQEMQRRILTSDPALANPALARPLVPGGAESRVLETASSVSEEEPSAGGESSGPQLPPSLPLFTGRTAELTQLKDVLRGSGTTVPVVGITGLTTMGKTALAIQLGYDLADSFPDGVFFIDCGSAEDPLAILLRMCGVSPLPETAADMVTRWRTLSSRRRILLVLDNVRDPELVRPLLPGDGGAAVIMTSQQRLFGLSHAQWITLGPFSESESLALLLRIIGRARVEAELSDAQRLVRLASGVPQAIHAIGARLASRPGWTLATAVERLTGPEYALESRYEECKVIQGPYKAAERTLSRGQRRALRLLALPSAPDISLTAAAAVLDLPLHETDYLLESLTDLHLLETSVGRYAYLNPVLQYARARALLEEGQTECHAALARLTSFYAASLANALMTIDPRFASRDHEPCGQTFESGDEAKAWLRDQERNLWEAVAQSADIREAPAERLARLIDQAQQAQPWSDTNDLSVGQTDP